MSESPFPSQNQDKFIVRLPDGMRDRIKAAAEAANRSMNAEIVATLEEKYPLPDNLLPHEIVALLLRLLEAPEDVREEIHPLLRVRLDAHGIPMTERLSDATIRVLLALPMDSDEDDHRSDMPSRRAQNALRFLSSGKRSED